MLVAFLPLSESLCLADISIQQFHLLAQINLAPAEALERLSGLLEAAGGGSLTLSERGDSTAVPRHPNFRLMAAMNPATGAPPP